MSLQHGVDPKSDFSIYQALTNFKGLFPEVSQSLTAAFLNIFCVATVNFTNLYNKDSSTPKTDLCVIGNASL